MDIDYIIAGCIKKSPQNLDNSFYRNMYIFNNYTGFWVYIIGETTYLRINSGSYRAYRAIPSTGHMIFTMSSYMINNENVFEYIKPEIIKCLRNAKRHLETNLINKEYDFIIRLLGEISL